MSAHIPKLADPPAEDLDSLEPVCHHVSTWRSRRPRKRTRNQQREHSPPLPAEIPVPVNTPATSEDADAADAGEDLDVASGRSVHAEPLESRLSQLEEVVHDCALLLRSSVVARLERVESSLADETARLDERLHTEARRRCRLLTEVTVKVSAAIDQLRSETKSAAATA